MSRKGSETHPHRIELRFPVYNEPRASMPATSPPSNSSGSYSNVRRQVAASSLLGEDELDVGERSRCHCDSESERGDRLTSAKTRRSNGTDDY